MIAFCCLFAESAVDDRSGTGLAAALAIPAVLLLLVFPVSRMTRRR